MIINGRKNEQSLPAVSGRRRRGLYLGLPSSSEDSLIVPLIVKYPSGQNVGTGDSNGDLVWMTDPPIRVKQPGEDGSSDMSLASLLPGDTPETGRIQTSPGPLDYLEYTGINSLIAKNPDGTPVTDRQGYVVFKPGVADGDFGNQPTTQTAGKQLMPMNSTGAVGEGNATPIQTALQTSPFYAEGTPIPPSESRLPSVKDIRNLLTDWWKGIGAESEKRIQAANQVSSMSSGEVPGGIIADSEQPEQQAETQTKEGQGDTENASKTKAADAIQKAINITTSFEGKGYETIAGNFDGQGLSLGMFQWNVGKGTLQPMLKQFMEENPEGKTDFRR